MPLSARHSLQDFMQQGFRPAVHRPTALPAEPGQPPEDLDLDREGPPAVFPRAGHAGHHELAPVPDPEGVAVQDQVQLGQPEEGQRVVEEGAVLVGAFAETARLPRAQPRVQGRVDVLDCRGAVPGHRFVGQGGDFGAREVFVEMLVEICDARAWCGDVAAVAAAAAAVATAAAVRGLLRPDGG